MRSFIVSRLTSSPATLKSSLALLFSKFFFSSISFVIPVNSSILRFKIMKYNSSVESLILAILSTNSSFPFTPNVLSTFPISNHPSGNPSRCASTFNIANPATSTIFVYSIMRLNLSASITLIFSITPATFFVSFIPMLLHESYSFTAFPISSRYELNNELIGLYCFWAASSGSFFNCRLAST